MLPANIPQFKKYKYVYAFVKDHLSMQFGDVRSMMRLPIPDLGITHACNFAATAVLCNLVSGISVSLYMPPSPVITNEKGKNRWVRAGEAFKSLLQDHYPWQSGENRMERAKVLYGLFRNPFAHALGVHGKLGHRINTMRRPGAGLQEDELEEIERSRARPSWLAPGLSGGGHEWNLFVEGFYRDVFHMLWKLARDGTQMRKAEKRFSRREFIWRQGKP